MSGTSGDGVDGALLRSDGCRIFAQGPGHSCPYPPALREALHAAVLRGHADPGLVRALTMHHLLVVRRLSAELWRRRRCHPHVIGLHGHTLWHRPEIGKTCQIGDAPWLARLSGLPVVSDLRAADLAGGGEGAPLAPILHAALAAHLPKPLAVLNLGGISNVTWISQDLPDLAGKNLGKNLGKSLCAFDCGPANGPINDWLKKRRGQEQDDNGQLAARGRVCTQTLDRLCAHPYFKRPPPKSLDRASLTAWIAQSGIDRLNDADGAATLTAFAAAAVAQARDFFPSPPRIWILCGGGRRNPSLCGELARRIPEPLHQAKEVGWNGDLLEAQAFALLALRSLYAQPFSFPSTTGVRSATSGGLFTPAAKTKLGRRYL